MPTADIFRADPRTGIIQEQDIEIVFEQFQTLMNKIGSQFTGRKQEYFFKLLDECSIDRFQALSTENSKITIYNVREAEIML